MSHRKRNRAAVSTSPCRLAPLLGMQAEGMAPKAPASPHTSTFTLILLMAPLTSLSMISFAFTNLWADPCLSADGTSGITKHDKLRIY
jgi:hypothetical protein